MELNQHDLDRVEELKRLGFEVVEAGFRNTHGEQVTNICYWRHMRGCRVSALFPNTAAAWRDALRTHEAAVDAVKENPGVHRVKAMPGKEAAELSRLKKLLLERGYTFSKEDKPTVDALDFNNYSHYWKRNGMQVGMFKSHADAIRDAIKCWARDEPEDFVNSMNVLGSGGSETEITPLTSVELVKLQSVPGFNEMPSEHKVLTIQSQQMLKHLAQRGIKIDMSAISPGTVEEAASVAYKSQGKTFEEARQLQAHGLPEDSEEFGMLRALECAGYQFHFTQNWGWKCEAVPKATGALVTAVKAAWAHALENGGNESDMAAVARGYSMTDEQRLDLVARMFPVKSAGWNGVGQPPVGTTLWVIPHNTLWGFAFPGPHLCKVLAYHNDHVWLERLSDLGETTHEYTTTRTDKVDVKVWKGNKDV